MGYLMLVGIFLIGNAVAMRLDRIRRNGVIGLRTRTTMASDRAWYAAQRAAAAWVALAGAIAFCGGAAAVVAEANPPVHLWILGPTVLALLIGTWRGTLAARGSRPD